MLAGTWTVKFHSSQCLTNHPFHNFPHTSAAVSVRSKTLVNHNASIHLASSLCFLLSPLFFCSSVFYLSTPLALTSRLASGRCCLRGRRERREGRACTVDVFSVMWQQRGSGLIKAMPSTHVELVLKVSDKTEVRHPAPLSYGPSSSLIWEAGHPSLSPSHFILPSLPFPLFLPSSLSGGSGENRRGQEFLLTPVSVGWDIHESLTGIRGG